MSGTIHIVRRFNRLLVGADCQEAFPGPVPKQVLPLLGKALSFIEIRHLHGKEKFEAKKLGLPDKVSTQWDCYGMDLKGRLGTSFGFLERIEQMLKKQGYEVRYDVTLTHPRPEAFEPRWDRIFANWTPRPRQTEFLVEVFANENGRFSCPPGWGKSELITRIVLGLPKAKIAIATKRVQVMTQRLYPELCVNLPRVGMVGGGKKIGGRRVTCYTFGSLHHCPDDIDILIVDEGHEAAADNIAYQIGKFKWARMYAVSASWDMRLDNKDLRCEAMFGPIRMTVTYQEAERKGVVVPILVKVRNVVMDEDPCGGLSDKVAKKRHGFWRNQYRNLLVAEDARRYPDKQVLITCETVEHVLELKKLIPEAVMIYREESVDRDRFQEFIDRDLIPEDYKPMTLELKQKRIRRLEKGRPGIYIGTTVLNVGVDFRYLAVVVRADGGGSPINDTQIPGRSSRINQAGKKVGIVHDYVDCFNKGFRQRSGRRISNYKEHGWTVESTDGGDLSRLDREMEW